MLYFDNEEFHVGDRERFIQAIAHAKLAKNGRVELCQADGDELELIREQFTGIPMSTARVVKWQGDVANFIFHHIKL